MDKSWLEMKVKKRTVAPSGGGRLSWERGASRFGTAVGASAPVCSWDNDAGHCWAGRAEGACL